MTDVAVVGFAHAPHVRRTDGTTNGVEMLMPCFAELYADLGYDVVTVDVTEYEKLEGCVTCLSVRLREAPRA